MPSSDAAERRQAFRARRTDNIHKVCGSAYLGNGRVVARDVNTLPRNIIIITISRTRYALANRGFASGRPGHPRRWSIGRTGLPEPGRHHAISAVVRRALQSTDNRINCIGG